MFHKQSYTYARAHTFTDAPTHTNTHINARARAHTHTHAYPLRFPQHCFHRAGEKERERERERESVDPSLLQTRESGVILVVDSNDFHSREPRVVHARVISRRLTRAGAVVDSYARVIRRRLR